MEENTKKVYVIDASGEFDFREHENSGNFKAIKREAEKRGTAYSLSEFQDGVNDEEINLSNSFILID